MLKSVGCLAVIGPSIFKGICLMLVLERNIDERIMIGRDIVVTLCSIRGERARIGIEAPRGVPVFREEVWIELPENRKDSK